MRILVPLDGSTFAEAAVTVATRLLHQTAERRELVLVHAVTDPRSQSYQLYTYPAAADAAPQESQLLDEIATERLEYLTQVAQRFSLSSTGITSIPVVWQREPVDVICTQAMQQHVDLIVLSSHGRTGLARLALGSVAEAVARIAPVPTIIVPDGYGATSMSADASPLWLVPIDQTPFSEAALPFIVAIASRLQVRLRLYTVLENEKDLSSDAVLRAESHLGTLCQHEKHCGMDITVQIAQGDPAEQILAEIAQHAYDLVVMATHGRTGVSRLFLGSVTETVLRHATVPILIMHPRCSAGQSLLPKEV